MLGLTLIKKEKDRRVFLKAENSMPLIFTPQKTSLDNGGYPSEWLVER
jgi:hypothetical protein